MDRPRLMTTAAIDLADHSAFRLGRLFVDPLTREVRYGEHSERLEPQLIKVLVALATRRGEVVTREELIDRCWNGRFVSDDVINRAILLLRRMATASRAFAIETVPKVGYRLTEAGPIQSYWRLLFWIAVVAVALVSASIFLLRGRADQSHPPPAVIQLAPFVASGGPAASETARASDAVIADMLTNIGMPVLKTNRTALSAPAADLRLSGQIRVFGDRVQATLQLDDLGHGTLLLSRRFDASREQAKNLPEQIGAFAATALGSTGAMMALDRQRPGDPRLTGELLRQWSMMILFEDAIGTYQAVDRIAGQMPDSAVAQLGLAMSTVHALPLLAPEDRQTALAKGRAAAARARALAPHYGDVAWPDCMLYSPVRMAQCEAVLRRAFAIDPEAPFVAAGLRNHFVDVGRFREALDYDRLAIAAMPYMAGRLSASTMLLESLGLNSQAEEQFRRVRRWWPDFHLIYTARIEGMLDRGSIKDAASFIGNMPADVDVIDRAAVASIAADVAAKKQGDVRSRCLSTSIDQNLEHFCLIALTQSGDVDGAFVLADRLYPNLIANDSRQEDRLFLQRSSRVGLGTLSAPALAPLRRDARYIPIAERVGLMRYWKHNHLPDFCTISHEPVCNRIVGQ